MTLSRTDHPCLSCRLPDCDDASRQCALRRAISEYRLHRRLRRPVTAEQRMRYSIARTELDGPDNARRMRDLASARREGLRP